LSRQMLLVHSLRQLRKALIYGGDVYVDQYLLDF